MRSCPHCLSPYSAPVEYCGIDGTRLQEYATDPLIGTDVDRYSIHAVLGDGAMARVYRATHRVLDREYAVKVLFGEIASNRVLSDRFRREAQVISKLDHPNVVSVIDFGETSRGLTFLTMELLVGRTLRETIQKEGVFSPERAGAAARQLALGLAEAHARGFVHRDLKPSNIMIVADGASERLKILDFGLARVTDSDSEDGLLTRTGQFLGTPVYMAPEQIIGADVTPAADLYALGVVLFEMLEGKPPFRAKKLAEIRKKHLVDQPPDARPSMGLEALVKELLAKGVEQRPESAREVIARIDALGLGAWERAEVTVRAKRPDLSAAPAPARAESQPRARSVAAAEVAAAVQQDLPLRAASGEDRAVTAEHAAPKSGPRSGASRVLEKDDRSGGPAKPAATGAVKPPATTAATADVRASGAVKAPATPAATADPRASAKPLSGSAPAETREERARPIPETPADASAEHTPAEREVTDSGSGAAARALSDADEREVTDSGSRAGIARARKLTDSGHELFDGDALTDSGAHAVEGGRTPEETIRFDVERTPAAGTDSPALIPTAASEPDLASAVRQLAGAADWSTPKEPRRREDTPTQLRPNTPLPRHDTPPSGKWRAAELTAVAPSPRSARLDRSLVDSDQSMDASLDGVRSRARWLLVAGVVLALVAGAYAVRKIGRDREPAIPIDPKPALAQPEAPKPAPAPIAEQAPVAEPAPFAPTAPGEPEPDRKAAPADRPADRSPPERVVLAASDADSARDARSRAARSERPPPKPAARAAAPAPRTEPKQIAPPPATTSPTATPSPAPLDAPILRELGRRGLGADDLPALTDTADELERWQLAHLTKNQTALATAQAALLLSIRGAPLDARILRKKLDRVSTRLEHLSSNIPMLELRPLEDRYLALEKAWKPVLAPADAARSISDAATLLRDIENAARAPRTPGGTR